MTGGTGATAKGSCLCGSVRYEVRAELRPVTFCHCSQCRKQTGLYYAATSAPADAVTIEGHDRLRWFQASEKAERGFCGTCGSALFWRPKGGAVLSILAGSINKGHVPKARKHIFVADAADWYDIADGLPTLPQSN